MSRICSLFIILLLFVCIAPRTYAAHQCGNGICQATGHVETCSTCPADCGACPVTPTTAPEPTATTAPGLPTSTPASSGSSSSSSSNSSSTSTTYYPSISINPVQSPTNKSTVTITGSASVQNGSIQSVEYTTNGTSWNQAQLSGSSYSITILLPEGNHSISTRAKSSAGVLTQQENYAKISITIATTPPTVTITKFAENPTKNLTPIISGTTSSKVVSIVSVEVSLDNGTSWNRATLRGNSFSYTSKKLDDGNYPVIARALDTAGNSGRSSVQTLIIDTIPPIIGGTTASIGPQSLTPRPNGFIQTGVGVPLTIQVSMRGGPTEASITDGTTTQKMEPIEGTNLWKTTMEFPREQEKPLKLTAIDGAKNKTERELTTLTVSKSGQIISSSKPVDNATVRVYYFDNSSHDWVLWDGKSFQQDNPQTTSATGNYSFMLPAGKYYIEVSKAGYKKAQSTIFTLATSTPINSIIELEEIPHATIPIPFVGNLTLSLGFLTPPATYTLQNTSSIEETNTFSLKKDTQAPNFSLPRTDEKQISLSSYKGKKVLLSFIAPWSPLSNEQAPLLHKAQQNRTGFEILAIVLQESPSTVNTYIKRGNYAFTALSDTTGITANSYKITVLPQHFFINSTGRIDGIHTGVLTDKEIIEKMSQVD